MFLQVAAMSPPAATTPTSSSQQQQPKQQQPPLKQTPEEHRIATQRCDKSWRAPPRASTGQEEAVEALSAYVRSDRPPVGARRGGGVAQGPSSYSVALHGPSVGSFRGS